MKPIQVGLLGIGTVGSGVFNVLKRNQAEIQRRAGRPIRITMVADLDTDRARSVVGDAVRVVADAVRDFDLRRYVLDPVMVSTSGARLLDQDAEQEQRRRAAGAADTPTEPVVAANRHRHCHGHRHCFGCSGLAPTRASQGGGVGFYRPRRRKAHPPEPVSGSVSVPVPGRSLKTCR